MSASARWDLDTGEHVETGHCGEGCAGDGSVRHQPVWGPWCNEGPMEMRQCLHPHCDVDEYR